MKIDRHKVYDKYGGCCAYCGLQFKTIKDMQIDHIVAKKCYKKNMPHVDWSKYKTPKALAEDIWPPQYDREEVDKLWFSKLREALVNWIKNY